MLEKYAKNPKKTSCFLHSARKENKQTPDAGADRVQGGSGKRWGRFVCRWCQPSAGGSWENTVQVFGGGTGEKMGTVFPAEASISEAAAARERKSDQSQRNDAPERFSFSGRPTGRRERVFEHRKNEKRKSLFPTGESSAGLPASIRIHPAGSSGHWREARPARMGTLAARRSGPGNPAENKGGSKVQDPSRSTS